MTARRRGMAVRPGSSRPWHRVLPLLGLLVSPVVDAARQPAMSLGDVFAQSGRVVDAVVIDVDLRAGDSRAPATRVVLPRQQPGLSYAPRRAAPGGGMPMSRIAWAVLPLVAVHAGCVSETSSIDGSRYPQMMIEVSGDPRIGGMGGRGTLDFAPPHDPPVAMRSDTPEGLTILLGGLDPTRLDIRGLPDPRLAPRGTRYFDELAFPDLRVEGTILGIPSHGQIMGHTLHIDALTGAFYAELPLRLVADAEPDAPVVELHLSIKGFVNVGCLQPETESSPGISAIGGATPPSPECAAVLSAIEATPTDPDAPPPPWDPDADVIECVVPDPCD